MHADAPKSRRGRHVSVVFTLVLVGGITLAGCGVPGPGTAGDSAPAPTASRAIGDRHNRADVEFVQQMIPHHQGALAMAQIVPDHTNTAAITDLADRIEKAQDPEIQQMRSWLETWNAAPSSSMSGMAGMDHGSMGGASPTMSMDGMSDGQDTTMFDGLEGRAFDERWLRMMIRHHEGAVTMAETELARGTNADARALAQRIIDGQRAEIKEMKGLLESE